MKLLEEEGVVSRQEVNDRDLLIGIVKRVNAGLDMVQIGRSSGTEIPGGMDLDIIDAIVQDLTRYDELNMQMSRKKSMEIESIAEEEEEEENGVAVVDKLPNMEEIGVKKGGNRFSEHRLRMTYVSKTQGEFVDIVQCWKRCEYLNVLTMKLQRIVSQQLPRNNTIYVNTKWH